MSKPILLLVSVFVVATCGLIYELVAGTVASYLLGDSVMQFSTIIGTYLFAMGIGSYLSKFFIKDMILWFVRIEVLVGLVGGISSTLLFFSFGFVEHFQVILYALVGLTGVLVGLEIPLLMRILEHKYEFKELVAKVFSVDYLGALFASILFPLVLVPVLGLMRTSLFFGILNLLVSLVVCFYFQQQEPRLKRTISSAIIGLLLLALAFVYSTELMNWSEQTAFQENVIFAKSTKYQRLVLTAEKNELRLYLNGNLQFSSADEYRYHETLVHPVMHMVRSPQKVLVLGGGDGMAVRELLKYPQVSEIILVDLDPDMTRLFQTNSMLTKLNQQALNHPKVKVYNQDAFLWLKKTQHQFDVIVIDFPDPSSYSIGKLYSTNFYRLLKSKVKENGAVVIQSTSPYMARKSFWCINQTIQYSGFKTIPYHTHIPSFGEWGYHIAYVSPSLSNFDSVGVDVKYITPDAFAGMTYFPPDISEIEAGVNKLNNQVLVHFFEKEWARYQ